MTTTSVNIAVIVVAAVIAAASLLAAASDRHARSRAWGRIAVERRCLGVERRQLIAERDEIAEEFARLIEERARSRPVADPADCAVCRVRAAREQLREPLPPS